MIDTMGFYIQISEEDYKKLMNMGILTERIHKDTGFIEFEYHNFKISHSWNYKVLWKVDNIHYIWDPQNKKTVAEFGLPYLKIEFSAPKVLHGHNLESITIEGMLDACLIVSEKFEKYSGVSLPGPGEWYIYRIDLCANFKLKNLDQVKTLIRYLQRLDYPRRKGNLYKDTGLYFASRHNTLKLYCKGDEFKRHDLERFKDELSRVRLQKIADKILRIEIETKGRIKYLVKRHEIEYNESFLKFKGCVNLEDFLYIVDIKNELERAIKIFLVGRVTKIMQSLDVFHKLSTVKGIRSARSYYAIYMLIVTHGQNEAKRSVPKRTYYKALKIFRENGISLIVSDENETEYFLDRGFPADFTFDMNEENKYYQLPISESKYRSDVTAEPL